MGLTFLVGGARSAKSSFAVDMGRRFQADGRGPVTFVATAPASDDEMRRRIEHHLAERPADWHTLEEQIDLGGVLVGVGTGLIIIDCLTLWTSNMMWAGRTDADIIGQAESDAQLAARRSDPVVVVSNDVGLGIVPDNDVARRYRDVHGAVNQRWARAAGTTLLLVAGQALRLETPWSLLDDPF
jgi:adenosyl cobinamide kinase/adenosyl cobinamide phosphate guanylyltransferase